MANELTQEAGWVKDAAKEEWKTCRICGRPQPNGITVVADFFICESCETEMVNTSVEDEKYPFFVRQLKPLWTHLDP
jgi:hypothetical protein